MRATPIAATFSKDPSFWFGKDPSQQIVKTIQYGDGAYVWDQDGKKYLDYTSGLGANLLGHNHRGFREAVTAAFDCGLAHSFPTDLEERVADKLRRVVAPHVGWNAEETQVRFGATGTDACMAALRLARWFTDKSHYLNFGYHGWSDPLVCHSPPAWGVIPEESGYVHDFEWNNYESLTNAACDGNIYRDDIAAIFIEHPAEPPTPHMLGWLEDLKKKLGYLLIVDEVVTGLRYGLGGACALHGYKPDIIVMGKALGNGLPISAVLARHEIMQTFERDDPVFVLSSTTNANALSLAAANYVLDNWNQKKINYIWQVGDILMRGLTRTGWHVIGEPPRSLIQFADGYEKAFFVRFMAEHGILMNRPNFPTLAHTEKDVEETIQVAYHARVKYNALRAAGKLESYVNGRLPRTLFTNR